MEGEGQTRGSWHTRAVMTGVGLVVGWLLHDLTIVIGSASLGVTSRILVRSIVVALAVTLVGVVLTRVGARIVAAIGVAVVGTALGVTVLRPTIDPAFIGLSKTVLILAVATAFLVRFSKPAGWAVGLPVGFVVAAATTAARRLHWGPVTDRYLLMESVLLAAGMVLLFVFFIRKPRVRHRLTVVVVALVCAVVAAGAGYGARLARADVPASSESAGGALPNLLLVVLDTVRADHLAAYGYERLTMPGLEAVVAEEFDLYIQARSTSSWTLPSHGSLLTGLMPSEHGATHTRRPEEGDAVAMRWSFANRLRGDVPTLAEQLTEQGFRTGGIVANDGVLNHEMGIARGFGHYDDRSGGGLQCRQLLVQQLGWEPQIGCLPYRDATAVTNLALKWLKRERSARPFFLFLNYMDAHEPYAPPEPFANAFEATRPFDRLKPPSALNALQYDRELLYLDHEISRLLSRLKANGLWEKTVIVITSDHGEAFGEHDHWGHAQNLYEELLRVPLFVKGVDGERSARRLDRPTGGHEVPELILEELGLEKPRGRSGDFDLIAEWYGSLAPVADRHQVSRDLLSWLDGSRKVIVGDDGGVEVYDLDLDPGEQARVPLVEEETNALLKRAREHWASRIPEAGAADLSPETLSRLRALGYLPSVDPGAQ